MPFFSQSTIGSLLIKPVTIQVTDAPYTWTPKEAGNYLLINGGAETNGVEIDVIMADGEVAYALASNGAGIVNPIFWKFNGSYAAVRRVGPVRWPGPQSQTVFTLTVKSGILTVQGCSADHGQGTNTIGIPQSSGYEGDCFAGATTWVEQDTAAVGFTPYADGGGAQVWGTWIIPSTLGRFNFSQNLHEFTGVDLSATLSTASYRIVPVSRAGGSGQAYAVPESGTHSNYYKINNRKVDATTSYDAVAMGFSGGLIAEPRSGPRTSVAAIRISNGQCYILGTSSITAKGLTGFGSFSSASSVAASNELDVICAVFGGNLRVSTDGGTTWGLATTGIPASSYQSVAYNPLKGCFCAVGLQDAAGTQISCAISRDGVTWVSGSLLSTHMPGFKRVASMGEYWFATGTIFGTSVAGTNSMTIWYSTDGLVWHPIPGRKPLAATANFMYGEDRLALTCASDYSTIRCSGALGVSERSFERFY